MSSSFPKTYKAAQFEGIGQPLTLVEKPLELPKPGEILMKVLATGICHSDHHLGLGEFGVPFPIVPGHESIGDIVAVGEGETLWKVGDRVGAAWFGGSCRTCDQCRRGSFITCRNGQINGVSRPGTYAEYCLLLSDAVVKIPESVDPVEYAPMLCAGITVFNSLRNMKLEGGATVAVQGIGGLGHLAIQYASKLGYKTIAISRGGGSGKEKFAKDLGADHVVDTSAYGGDTVKALNEATDGLGVDCIMCTAPVPAAISPLIDALAPKGKLLILAAAGPVEFNTVPCILKQLSVCGWPSGGATDSEEAVAFAERTGVKCMVEKYPLEKVQAGLDSMVNGKARFRSVIVFDQN